MVLSNISMHTLQRIRMKCLHDTGMVSSETKINNMRKKKKKILISIWFDLTKFSILNVPILEVANCKPKNNPRECSELDSCYSKRTIENVTANIYTLWEIYNTVYIRSQLFAFRYVEGEREWQEYHKKKHWSFKSVFSCIVSEKGK